MSDNLLQIGEFAKRTGTNLRTLRYYEELGLIAPARRSSGKFRYYSLDQIERVAAIKRLQGLGMSLKEICDMLPGTDDLTDSPLARIKTALETQIKLVGERIATLQDDLTDLHTARAKIDQYRQCEHGLDDDSCECSSRIPTVQDVLRSLHAS